MASAEPPEQPTPTHRETLSGPAPPAPVKCRLEVGSRTDVGRARTRNEDSLLAEPPDSSDAQARGWFGAVADGVGGRPAGDVASRLAVQTSRDAFYEAGDQETTERLLAAIGRANDAIYLAARRSPKQAGMASTITAAAIRDGRLFVAQVGDTRAYLVRNGQSRRLTRDHNVVQEGLRAGLLTPEQARDDPRRNLVTRVLGNDSEVRADLVQERVDPGDVIVLCSDGLHGLVSDAEISAATGDDPQRAADTLVTLANERGGHDNISVITARLTPIRATADAAPARVGRARLWVFAVIAALVAVLTVYLLVGSAGR